MRNKDFCRPVALESQEPCEPDEPVLDRRLSDDASAVTTCRTDPLPHGESAEPDPAEVTLRPRYVHFLAYVYVHALIECVAAVC